MPVKPKKAPKGPVISDDYMCLPSGPIACKKSTCYYTNLF